MSVDYDAIAARRASASAPVPVSSSTAEAVKETLTAAFGDDPVMAYFLKPDEGFDPARAVLIGRMVDQYMETGWAITAEDASCAMLWARPGKPAQELGLIDQLKLMPTMAKICGFSRLPRIIEVMDALEKHHPHEPDHFYLFMIGVNPAHQGQGLGSCIMEKALAEVDAAGMPAYLENSNPRNTPFYERHGFKLTGEITFGKGKGPKLWPMWRDAR